MLVVGVKRSPFAVPGQVVEVDEANPRVAHYLGVGVLREHVEEATPAPEESPAPAPRRRRTRPAPAPVKSVKSAESAESAESGAGAAGESDVESER